MGFESVLVGIPSDLDLTSCLKFVEGVEYSGMQHLCIMGVVTGEDTTLRISVLFTVGLKTVSHLV